MSVTLSDTSLMMTASAAVERRGVGWVFLPRFADCAVCVLRVPQSTFQLGGLRHDAANMLQMRGLTRALGSVEATLRFIEGRAYPRQ